jgi:hypothetical protein
LFRSFVNTDHLHLESYDVTLDDGTSATILVRHEARSLYENTSKEYVLVSNRCYSGGRHNTAWRAAVVRPPSYQVKSTNGFDDLEQDVQPHSGSL